MLSQVRTSFSDKVRRVAGLQAADLEALRPRVGQLVALDRLALEVKDDDRATLTDVVHLAEAAVLDPILEALIGSEAAGQRNVWSLGAARQPADLISAVGTVFLVLHNILLHLESSDLADRLDRDAIELESK